MRAIISSNWSGHEAREQRLRCDYSFRLQRGGNGVRRQRCGLGSGVMGKKGRSDLTPELHHDTYLPGIFSAHRVHFHEYKTAISSGPC